MSGSSSRPIALAVGAIALATGVVLAAPVPVLSFSDGTREVVARLDDGEAVTYAYRQSIYEVPVYEEFERRGDVLALLRVRSPDIRSVEYFRWQDGTIARDDDGLWTEDAPRSDHADLVIRVAPQGQQVFRTGRWSTPLLTLFGETVVTVRVERRPFAATLLAPPR